MSEQYYIVESSGDVRRMWGPYQSYEAAVRQAGVRHIVVTGSGCRQRTLTHGELKAAVGTGSIRPASPHVIAANI